MVTIRAMGVSGTPKALFFAVAEGGEILDVEPQRVEIPDGLRRSDSLRALADDLHRRLAQAAPAAVAVLLPQGYDGGQKATTARVGAETVLRLTAHDMGIDVDLLSRPTARTRLGLGPSGSLDDRLKKFLPTPVGRYWAQGRRLAAFAALACVQAAF